MMRLYINSLIAKTGWQLFTPDNHLTPIFRYKLFDRLAEPGYSGINRFIESAYPPIKTSIRVGHFHFKEALSSDSIPMETELTILFKFDPRGCQRQLIAQFALVGDEVFEAIIEDYARQGLMQLIGRYSAEALKDPSIQNQIKNALFRAVNADVSILGLSIPALGCVTIQRLMPHDRYLRTQLENANLAAKLKQLAFADEKVINFLFKTDFLHTLENMSDGNMVLANWSDSFGSFPLAQMTNGRFPEQPPKEQNSSGFSNHNAEAD